MTKPKRPKTVKNSVKVLMGMLSGKDKAYIARLGKHRFLSELHHGFGTMIRNDFGLWRGNKALLKACGSNHPDDASSVIITALWNELQGSPWKKRDWAMHKELL